MSARLMAAGGRAWPAIATRERRAAQRQEQLLQVRLGDALALCDLGRVHWPLAVPARDLDHGVRRVVGALR